MYEGHFQLDRRPFAATPDPGCCYLSPTQTPLFQTVSRCIENGQGIAILTGPAGIGKTLLVQVLLAESAQRFTTVYLGTGQFPTRRALLQAILYELGQAYGGMTDQELRLELNTALRNLITQRDGLLLILDEAHLLSDRLLEEIRLLADLAQHGVPLMRVVLSGNPEFEERLTHPALAAFNQRVACHVALETLTQSESIAYLEHRIQWAGGHADHLFEREALQLIAYASDGVPRCLNQLADHSLMQAYLTGATSVSAAGVRQALADVQHLSLRWNPSALHDRFARTASPANSSDDVLETHVSTIDLPTSQGEAFEVGHTEDNETACFEFGAGDGGPAVSMTLPVPEVDAGIVEFGFETEQDTESEAETDADTGAEVDLKIEPMVEGLETLAEQAAPVADNYDDEDDEDGPPLFAWLAKPAKADPVTTSGQGDLTSSRVTSAARGRSRAMPVEQEIVSTSPLAGAELIGHRTADPYRAVSSHRPRPMMSHSELPPEELVVDGYARLDAPLTPMFPRPAPTLVVPVLLTNTPAEAVSAEETLERDWAATATAIGDQPSVNEPIRQTSRWDSFDNATPAETAHRPLDRIDSIGAMLEELEDYSHAGSLSSSGVELITDYGVERIDVDLSADTQLPSGISAEQRLPLDLEDWIGSTVVEVGRDLQQQTATSFPASVDRVRAKKVATLLEEIERASQYDVVEPDFTPAASTSRVDREVEMTESAAGATGAVPPPNHSFKNLFSVLRRRQTR